jgi:hypothetical protein
LFWSHKEVVEGLFDGKHKGVIGGCESAQFGGILHELFRRFDPKSFCQPGVTLTLSALGNALELYGFPRDRVARACPAGCSLLYVAARTSLIHSRTARFILGTSGRSVASDRTGVFAICAGVGLAAVLTVFRIGKLTKVAWASGKPAGKAPRNLQPNDMVSCSDGNRTKVTWRRER